MVDITKSPEWETVTDRVKSTLNKRSSDTLPIAHGELQNNLQLKPHNNILQICYVCENSFCLIQYSIRKYAKCKVSWIFFFSSSLTPFCTVDENKIEQTQTQALHRARGDERLRSVSRLVWTTTLVLSFCVQCEPGLNLHSSPFLWSKLAPNMNIELFFVCIFAIVIIKVTWFNLLLEGLLSLFSRLSMMRWSAVKLQATNQPGQFRTCPCGTIISGNQDVREVEASWMLPVNGRFQNGSLQTNSEADE